MAETRILGSIHVVTDSETHYDNIGDVQGSFGDLDNELKKHIKRFRSQQLLETLSHMVYQVRKAQLEIYQEDDKEFGLPVINN